MRAHPIRQKLQSQQGASILFALFFFIVCAVIGSIVLTAATAAAGRLSRVKEMDQRYYAVTSAAQVMEKMINNASLSDGAVVTGETYQANKWDGTDWKPVDKPAEGESSPDWSNFSSLFPAQTSDWKAVMTYDDKDEHANALTGMRKTAVELVSQVASGGEAVNRTRTYTVTGADISDITRNVTVTVTLKILNATEAGTMSMPEKSLLVTITGQNQEMGTEQSYTLTLKCHSHTDKRTEYTEKVYDSQDAGGNRVSTRYRLVTDKETITWSVAEVVKGAQSS